MSIRKFLTIGSLAASVFIVGCDKDDDENVTAQDQSFMRQAAVNNRAEIELGTLALTKATDPSVRNFAQMMITDHTAAQTQLGNIADDVDFDLPNLDTAGAAMKTMLNAMDGHAFDSAYIHGQVMAHQLAETVMQTEIDNGSNQQLRDYATQTLPKIQMHLNMADTMSSRFE